MLEKYFGYLTLEKYCEDLREISGKARQNLFIFAELFA